MRKGTGSTEHQELVPEHPWGCLWTWLEEKLPNHSLWWPAVGAALGSAAELISAQTRSLHG